jgi:hypothetical protein
MNHHLGPLLKEIQELERLVSDKIHPKTEQSSFELKGGKAVFQLEVLRRHKTVAKRIWRYLLDSSLLSILTVPVIYSILVPISLLDLLVSLYQRTCFPVYAIPHVRRSDFVVVDRHRLAYLNLIERFNCVYCGYANGVLAYAREIASRTEQYWCPIKHARRLKGCHSRQCMFCEYGDAEGFRREFDELRRHFTDLEQPQTSLDESERNER